MEIRHLYFQYHKKAPYFFRDLNLYLEPGKLHALHGKNGVGKTALFQVLSAKVDPNAIVQGEILGGPISLLHQRFDQALVDTFSFQENLQFSTLARFPRPFLPLASPSSLPDFAERFHIDTSIPIGRLSGGQRQILSLLMCLQRRPRVLLLDEPTATLDEQNAILVFEFLQSLAKEMTLLVVCHDRELVERFTTGSSLSMEMGEDGTRHIRSLSHKAAHTIYSKYSEIY